METYPRKTGRLGGFSFIELMVVIAIIGIVSAMTLVSLSKSRAQKDVLSNARTLAATIREAQNYALTGKNINVNVAGNVPCEFHVTATGTSYKVEQKNVVAAGGCAAAYTAGTTVPLLNGVSVSTTEVRFAVPRGDPKNGSGADLTTGNLIVDFKLTKGAGASAASAHVCIYPFGRIEEQLVSC